ncbi:MAG TPA: ABC transporter permease [Ktedonosporobacter sp.]|nr:ABC transporter permease [Ktedonosporobacter sp.]
MKTTSRPAATASNSSTPLPGAKDLTTVQVSERWREVWRGLTHNPRVMVGLCIMTFFLLVAIFGPFFLQRDPNALSSDALLPPSARHWFGTTQTGQDIFVQLIYGTQTSMLWGLLTGALITILSLVIGLVAGYCGGVVDEILSLLMNIFLVMPSVPLAIVLATYIPYKGPVTVALVITLTSWAWGARLLRAQTLSLRKRDFVEAARASGETTFRIIFYEILPNEIALVAAGFVGSVLFVILAEAGLEFLGLGNITIVSWGSMFYWAQNNDALMLGAWWWFLPPGLSITVLGTALALLNYAIDEIADPRLRRVRIPKRR